MFSGWFFGKPGGFEGNFGDIPKRHEEFIQQGLREAPPNHAGEASRVAGAVWGASLSIRFLHRKKLLVRGARTSAG
jgi:hypothetical protein